MALIELPELRDGKWGLFAAPEADPAWVGWIHDDAAGWMNEVVRLRDAGVAAGLEIAPMRERSGVQATRPGALATSTADPARWAAQVEHTRALVSAIGQLARAINTPVPSLRPWAEGLLYRDRGSSPWEGWGHTSPGEWRYNIAERVERQDARVREAARTGWLVFDQLAHRVGLSVDGLPNVAYLQGLAPNVLAGHDADYHQSDCGVVGAAPSGWSCVDWSVWYPSAGSAEVNTLFAAIVPLGWQWELAAEVANALEAMGSVEQLLAECRAWVNVNNSNAVNYMRDTLHLAIATPQDILTQQASDQAARYQVPASARITRMVGAQAAALITNPYVAAAIAIATAIPEILYPMFGAAQGYAIDVWGRRDPAVFLTSISGSIDLRHPRAPTQSVAPLSTYETLTGPRGPSLSERRRTARATLQTRRAADVREAGPRAGELGATGPVVTTKKKSGGGAVALGLAAALIALAK